MHYWIYDGCCKQETALGQVHFLTNRGCDIVSVSVSLFLIYKNMLHITRSLFIVIPLSDISQCDISFFSMIFN